LIGRVVLFVTVLAALYLGLRYSQERTGPLVVSGFLEADEVRVGSRVGGRVLRVHIEEGQSLEVGATLVELEPFDLAEKKEQAEARAASAAARLERLVAGYRAEEIAQALARRDQLAAKRDLLVAGPRKQEIETGRARLDLAKAEEKLAALDFERAQTLTRERVTSERTLDQTRNQLEVAQALVKVRVEELALLEEGTREEEIREAEARLAEAEQALLLVQNGYREEEIDEARATLEAERAAVRAIERQVAELVVRAPVAGVVETVDLLPGDLVAAGAPALSLLDTSRLWVRAYVPENRLDLALGDRVEVAVDSYPGERFAGEVVFVAREAEFTPGNVQTPEERSKQVFRIKVDLREGLERLRAGMAADVVLEPR